MMIRMQVMQNVASMSMDFAANMETHCVEARDLEADREFSYLCTFF